MTCNFVNLVLGSFEVLAKLIGPCSNARAQILAMLAVFIEMFIFLQPAQKVKVLAFAKLSNVFLDVLNFFESF